MYIADDQLIVCTLGVRWVVKSDKTYGADNTYYLEIQYKGSNRQIVYKDKGERDEMFNRLSSALTMHKARTSETPESA